jgi:hypothetical protein
MAVQDEAFTLDAKRLDSGIELSSGFVVRALGRANILGTQQIRIKVLENGKPATGGGQQQQPASSCIVGAAAVSPRSRPGLC